MEGSSFDPERKAREELAKSEALQKELQAQKDTEKAKPYAILRSPSSHKDAAEEAAVTGNGASVSGKKKKKSKRHHDE